MRSIPLTSRCPPSARHAPSTSTKDKVTFSLVLHGGIVVLPLFLIPLPVVSHRLFQKEHRFMGWLPWDLPSHHHRGETTRQLRAGTGTGTHLLSSPPSPGVALLSLKVWLVGNTRHTSGNLSMRCRPPQMTQMSRSPFFSALSTAQDPDHVWCSSFDTTSVQRHELSRVWESAGPTARSTCPSWESFPTCTPKHLWEIGRPGGRWYSYVSCAVELLTISIYI